MELKRIVTKCPARVSFANGGDTDYYLEEIGWGCIVNLSLSSLYYQCKVSGDDRIVKYKDLFNNKESVSKYEDLLFNNDNLDLIKASIMKVNPFFTKGLNIITNIPSESGLGGSSSLNVALLLALIKDKGGLTNAQELAEYAYNVERVIMNVPGGYQDQWAAAYGRGFNLMLFKDKKVEVLPINVSEENLRKLEQNSLLVYFAKRETSGSDMHKSQAATMEVDKEAWKRTMFEKRDNVFAMKEALESGDFEKFVDSLNKDWELKQMLSNKMGMRDDLFKIAIENGALAGKLCGAGGGGTYYFYCQEGMKYKVLDAIRDKIIGVLPFHIQRSHEQGWSYDLEMKEDDPKVVFLDRDGVINKQVHFLHKKEEFELLPGVGEAIKLLKDNKYKVFVTTNQPVVARGFCTEDDVKDMHEHMNRLLSEYGAIVDKVYYCPHHPSVGDNPLYTRECGCRKPKAGMINKAKEEFNLGDISQAYMIGDSISDIKSGDEAGCKTILVSTGYGGNDGWGDAVPMYNSESLYKAVKEIVLK
ncbi:MAG: HAD-IIIA family hydrolase [Nanoarchaeota archaeon]|nr:HAD-IIIA family hydrolase [Nanoarchaeota archaeon]